MVEVDASAATEKNPGARPQAKIDFVIPVLEEHAGQLPRRDPVVST
jgi:hypothetical protein